MHTLQLLPRKILQSFLQDAQVHISVHLEFFNFCKGINTNLTDWLMTQEILDAVIFWVYVPPWSRQQQFDNQNMHMFSCVTSVSTISMSQL